jgi:hypothetical protein
LKNGNYKKLKNIFKVIKEKRIQVDKRIIFILGIVFIVSPGWILGLYWMKFEKLPWEKKPEEQPETSITQDIDNEEENDTLTEEEKLALLIKNDVFEPFPFDLTEKTVLNNVLLENQLKRYTFHETYLVINGKQYTFTNHTEMFRKGKTLDVNKGIEFLEKGTSINELIYTQEGLYVQTIIFN